MLILQKAPQCDPPSKYTNQNIMTGIEVLLDYFEPKIVLNNIILFNIDNNNVIRYYC